MYYHLRPKQDPCPHLQMMNYTLEAMGLLEKLHQEVFAAIHSQKVNLNDPTLLSDWIGSKGVDRKKFKDTYDSFAVQSRTQRVLEVTRAYDIPGTPAVIIDGRYLTAPSMVVKADKSIDYDRYFKIVDEMIAVARKNRTAK